MSQLERDPAGQGPVRKVQLDRDRLFARDRHSTERISYEGFCEDLARQSTVAHLFQRQLGFRRRHTWVSVPSHMGFSHRRSVLKTTI
jgi:hypothetical protein